MAIAFTLAILVALSALGYNLYTCWREQQSYAKYATDFRQEQRSQVDDASRSLAAPSQTWR